MAQTLSVVLPVRNAQNDLARQIGELLEVLPDLAPRFEVLIVDDASTDQTEELAHELCRQYPQLRVIRQPRAEGVSQAIQSGIEHSLGDVIFVKDNPAVLRASELRRLWALRQDKQLLMAQSQAEQPKPKPLDADLIRRLMSWGAAIEQNARPNERGIQMIRRQALEEMEPAESAETANGDGIAAENADSNSMSRISRTDQILRRMPPLPAPTGFPRTPIEQS